jgi:hypothetical protein
MRGGDVRVKCGKQQSWHEAAQDLRTKLSRYAAKPRFNDEFEEAFVFFFGEGPDEMQDELEPAAFGRFMEWFVHDYRLSHGHRLIELFGMEFATELPCRKRHLLEAWQKSRMTLLEIETMARGVAEARDLVLGGEYSILLPAPANVQGIPVTGRLLVGRLLRVGELWEMPYGVAVFPSSYRERFLQILRGEYRRYKRSRGGDWGEFLQEQGFVFNDLIENLDDEMATGGRQTRFRVRAFFDVVDMNVCVKGMCDAVGSALPCRQLRELEGASEAVTWPDMPGSLRLCNDRLELTCFSPEEMDIAKQIVASRLGGAVSHRLDAIERYSDSEARPAPLLRPGLVGQSSRESPGQRVPLAWRAAHTCSETAATCDASAGADAVTNADGESGPRQQKLCSADPPIPAAASTPDCYSEGQRQVANRFCKTLMQTGASDAHLDSALWLWSDFCRVEHPRIRKAPAWAAAVHASLGRVEGWRLRVSALARLYGANPTSVSRNAALIAAALGVQKFDDRYCVEHPVDGLLKRLGTIAEQDMSAQAEELFGAGVLTEQTELTQRLVALRNVVITYAQGMEQLSRRAHEQFFQQVGCSPDDTFWHDCFVDWFHFDWAIPVRGGRTVLEQALEEGNLAAPDAEHLAGWRDCHPAYYIVEAVPPFPSENQEALVEIRLRMLGAEGRMTVVWPLPVDSLRRGDVLLARLVPLNGVMTSVGHALHFSATLAPAVKRRLDEERALLEQWNGCKMRWEDISARYAERLYAIAYRAARGFPDEL